MLGLALIAMAEPLGSTMASRMLEHLLQYGEPPGGAALPVGAPMAACIGCDRLHACCHLRGLTQLLALLAPPTRCCRPVAARAVRRAVPLALALLNVSDPGQQVVDALSRLSHDADTEVAQAAILALGIVGAGEGAPPCHACAAPAMQAPTAAGNGTRACCLTRSLCLSL